MNPVDWSSEIEKKTVEIFRELIRINTINPPGQETVTAKFLQGILAAEGIESQSIEAAKGGEILLAKLAGWFPHTRPLVFLSHLDGGPAKDGRWRYSPTAALVIDLISLILLNRYRPSLNRNVYLIAGADKENESQVGMEYLVKHYPEYFRNGIVLTESGGLPVKTQNGVFLLCSVGEKGSCKVKLRTEGTPGHASFPPADQAVLKLADMLERISQYRFPAKDNQLVQYFRKKTGIRSEEDNQLENTTINDLYHYMRYDEVSVNRFDIGEALNIIPYRTETEIEFRILPGTKPGDIEAVMEELSQDTGVDWEMLSFEAGYRSDLETDFFKLAGKKAIQFGAAKGILPFLAPGRAAGRFSALLGSSIYGFSPVLNDTPFTGVQKMVDDDRQSLAVESLLYGTKMIGETVYQFCVEQKGKL